MIRISAASCFKALDTYPADDVRFFNGQVVHGSLPKTTDDQFHRTLIPHQFEGDAQQVAEWYFPLLRMSGSTSKLSRAGQSAAVSQCGIWIGRDSNPVRK